jgi:predicted DNA-binding transcriptional regulator YafY
VRVAPDGLPHLQHLLGEEVGIHLEQASPLDATGWRTIPVTFERVDDARRAILGCGTLVEVVEPWELRESIAEAAAGVVALYSGCIP